MACDTATLDLTCAEQTVADFARRAFRRPVTEEEIDSLMGPFRKAQELGATNLEGLRYSLAATLMSPHFLFKVELRDLGQSEPQRLSPHELATRLSYALWATMPDDALMRAADDGSLVDDATLEAQLARMLADPRADALIDTFAAEWLGWTRLATHEIDTNLYPEYDDALAAAMEEEARLYVRAFLREDRPLTELLAAPFTHLDARLARHYGMAEPMGDGFTRVDTSSTPRRGLLSLGALLTTTSLSTRTSPVKRGEFVTSRLLCFEVPPPPEGVGPLPEPQPGLTLRERMEAHRDDPACSGCHSVMDPIRFGLENFDPVGVYRTEDNGDLIDASGELPSGASFSGPTELGAAVTSNPDYLDCVARKFTTYAVGRLLDEADDHAWTAQFVEQFQQDDGSLRSLIRQVVMSDLFRSGS